MIVLLDVAVVIVEGISPEPEPEPEPVPEPESEPLPESVRPIDMAAVLVSESMTLPPLSVAAEAAIPLCPSSAGLSKLTLSVLALLLLLVRVALNLVSVPMGCCAAVEVSALGDILDPVSVLVLVRLLEWDEEAVSG